MCVIPQQNNNKTKKLNLKTYSLLDLFVNVALKSSICDINHSKNIIKFASNLLVWDE